ncbi:hypothetical protein [Actinoallomurus vinaceus]|uniref:hypothetical protein n=1 Tax=Actinoallomurus vinaceus TaxID=1080074 RepID=UPI0031EEB151
MTSDRRPRLADVFPGLVSDIVQALSVEGAAESFTTTFKNLLFYGRCPSCGPRCLLTAPLGTPSPAMTVVEREGEPIALLSLDVDPAGKTIVTITHVEVVDGRHLGGRPDVRDRRVDDRGASGTDRPTAKA